MVRRLFRILATLVLPTVGVMVGLIGPIALAYAEKRVALVIGNNDYEYVPKLARAVNDANAMGETLKQLGFSVTVAENQDRRQFSEAMLAFGKMIEPGDTAFFFYAGHGFEIAGQNYLLPTDIPAATEGQEELVRDSSILADSIVEWLQDKHVRTSILVFDACRNNPFQRAGTRAIAGSGGLAPMTQLPEGVFSVFSAGPHQTALDRLSNDDANPNSVFTRVFAKELLKPGENLVQVAQQTRRIVSEMAEGVKHKQVPVYFDQMVDNVFLSDVDTGKTTFEPPPVKIAALPPVSVPHVPKADPANAPMVTFSPNGAGWSMSLVFAEPTLGISWRFGDTGDFRETGFRDWLDSRTRKRLPNSTILLTDDTPAGTIEVRYVDAAGEMRGPFPIKFDPVVALRELLDADEHWLSVFYGNVFDYRVLIHYRCAIREARIGIDKAVPDKVLKLPPCTLRNPGSTPKDTRTDLKVPPQTRSVSVELTYHDGRVSEIRTFRR